jgi:hypothetical protein
MAISAGLQLKFLKERPYKVDVNMGIYQKHWVHLNLPTTACNYICELISKALNIETNKKTGKADDLIELQFIGTLNALGLLLRLEGQEQLSFMKSKWEDHQKKSDKHPNKHPYVDSIINNIFKLHLERRDIIQSVLAQCCFVREMPVDFSKPFKSEDIENYLKLTTDMFTHFKIVNETHEHAHIIYNSLKGNEIDIFDTSEFSFNYEYVLRYIVEHRRVLTPELINAIHYVLKVIPLSLRENSSSSMKSASCIIHIIKQILTLYPVKDMQIHKLFLTDLDIYRKWPMPVGYMANEVCDIILEEMKTPSINLIMALREILPLIDFLVGETEDLENNITHIAYVVGDDSPETDYIIKYNIENVELGTILDAHQYRCLLVAYIVTSDPSVIPQSWGAPAIALQNLLIHLAGVGLRDIFIVYCRLLNILEKLHDFDNIVESKNILKSVLGELLNDIMKMNDESGEIKQGVLKVFKDMDTLIPPFPYGHLRELGRVNVKDKQMFKGKGTNKKENTSYVEYDYNSALSYDRIIKLMEANRKPTLPLHEQPLKFVIIGGDIELNYFLQDFLQVYMTNPKLFVSVDFRIYLIPTKNFALAQLVASKDVWYQRNVYIPFNTNPLIPKLDPQQDNLKANNDGDKEKLFPFDMKESLIQTYLREATYKFCPVVYEILCFYQPMTNTSPKPDLYVYFCEYVDIGSSVLIWKQKLQDKKKAKDKEPFDTSDYKNIRTFSVDLKIKVDVCEFTGFAPKKTDETVIRSVHDLSINNVSREYMKTPTPIPTSGWLEMAYIDADNHTQEDKAMKNKDKFKKLKPDQINTAFTALYTMLHIKSATITSVQNAGIEFIADGRLFSGFTCLVIQPVKNYGVQQDCNFTLPIMSFLPVQL